MKYYHTSIIICVKTELVFRRKRADFTKQIVFSAHFAHQIKIISNTRKQGKPLLTRDLPRYYKFMLFAVYYSSTAACAAAKNPLKMGDA